MSNQPHSSQSSRHGELYQIRVGQHLDAECSPWLGGLTIANLDGGEAVLSGVLADQAALSGVLQCLRDWNVPLLDLRRNDPVSPFIIDTLGGEQS